MKSVVSYDDLFGRGSVPETLEGFYRGKLLRSIPGELSEFPLAIMSSVWFPWKGKIFHMDKQEGEDVFSKSSGPIIRVWYDHGISITPVRQGVQVFSFQTSIKRSLVDKVDVLSLDYNLTKNPLQLRNILQEIVRTEKGLYLGKMYIRDGNTIRLSAVFSLKKEFY